MPPADTIPGLLALRRREGPDARALVDDGGAVTYAELDDASRALAARLVAAGAGKGDRVGLVAPNGIGWATIGLAVMRIGAVLVPLSTLLRPPELRAQLRTAAVTHLVTVRELRGRSYLDDLEAAAPGVLDRTAAGDRHPAVPSLRHVWPADQPALPNLRSSDRQSRSHERNVEEVVRALEGSVRPADDMVVLFTSGSRGAPKGTIHTHGGALRAVASGLEARRVGPDDRLYIPMPFFWTGGLSSGLLTALVAGATLLTEAVPEPDRTLAMLARERVTLFRGWPDQAARLAANPGFAAADLSSLRPGSLDAVLPPEHRAAPGARPNLFGMTETFGPYCGDRLDVDLPPGKHGSCGRPFPGVEARVVDGEIQLRGPNLMRGICGRDHSAVFTADGFYPTGDLGRIDEDGYLWYQGRLDDMFKVKGATVYPSEVEAALRGVPGVSQAFVTEVAGQVGALVVASAAPSGIADAARARLSAFKVPTVWLVTPDPDAVPMLATGKVDKAGLQQLLRSRATEVPRP